MAKYARLNANTRHFDFSLLQLSQYAFDFSPLWSKPLKEGLKRLGGKPKVFAVHGAEGNCELLANWAKTDLGLDAVAPRTGEKYQI